MLYLKHASFRRLTDVENFVFQVKEGSTVLAAADPRLRAVARDLLRERMDDLDGVDDLDPATRARCEDVLTNVLASLNL